MKRFHVPLIEVTVFVHVGASEWASFLKAVWRKGALKLDRDDVNNPSKSGGRAWGGWLWVSDIQDTNTLMHEVSHVLDNTMGLIDSNDTEFRAYIAGWLISSVLEWRDNEKH